MGLSALFPVLHGVVLYGVDEMRGRIGLTWLVLQGVLYILGAGIYAVSSPTFLNAPLLSYLTPRHQIHPHHGSQTKPKLRPTGTFPRAFLSRPIRHMGIIPPNLPRPRCYGRFITPMGISASF
jgi:predicted membrane channel-forming protein YqfA (hemolysin III family)